MKPTRIIERIDSLGRIAIPKEILHALRIIDGDLLEIYIKNNNEIVLKKSQIYNYITAQIEGIVSQVRFDDCMQSQTKKAVMALLRQAEDILMASKGRP